MVYVDSSALLKLLWDEPDSGAVRRDVDAEDVVVVSSLTELEVAAQLRARSVAGDYGPARWRRYRTQLAAFRRIAPFRFQSLPGTVFETAIAQAVDDRGVHCRTLDRLHLASMAELGIDRLMTSDVGQAAAARALGFTVVVPGRSGGGDG